MITSKKIYISVLALLISFGSIGAVCFTPGLPAIANYFSITDQEAQLTVTWYLWGYAFGQLLYGPLTNRFGSKAAVKIGAIMAMFGGILCVLSYFSHSFTLLLVARLIMALGAASGLKMTFTISNKLFSTEENARVLGLLTMAFAITPGLGVFLGGILVNLINWTAPFYLMIIYAFIILVLNKQLPEVYPLELRSTQGVSQIVKNYLAQFQNFNLICGGLLVGLGSCFVYIFAAISPFLIINIMQVSPERYGLYNFIPSLGILFGSLASSHLGKTWSPQKSLGLGLIASIFGSLFMLICIHFWKNNPFTIFIPITFIYFGLSFLFGNSAALALRNAKDVSNASAIMSFINMGSAFVATLIVGKVQIDHVSTLLSRPHF